MDARPARPIKQPCARINKATIRVFFLRVVPGDTIMTHLTHFVQFDALAPRAASGFYVLLANGTREYVEPPNATFANGTAVNATAGNAPFAASA